jgi:SSS family transporter
VKALASLLLGLLPLASAPEAHSADRLSWSELPPLPDTPGLGGPFVGTHGGVLLVAGGANFPDAPPWEGGRKVWHSDVLVLEPGAKSWRHAGHLEGPLAYGAAVSTPEGLALLGGSDGERHRAACWLLSWDEASRSVGLHALPSLPAPTAFPAAAAVGDVIYLAAGSASPDPTDLTHAFWALDLSRPPAHRAWEERPRWPGPARHKAVAAAQSAGGASASFYLFSGEIPSPGADGRLDYDYRTDAYRFAPGAGTWERLGDLPKPVAAATATPLGQSQVLVFSGSTGAHVKDPDPRPEFPRVVLSYHTITDTWTVAGGMPQAAVTTGAVRWQDRIVLASGEVRPGIRTPAVRMVEIAPDQASFGLLNTVVLVVYLLALVAIGVRFARRERSTGDFFLAGRRIPWWAAGISIFATQLSAITFVSTPAVAYATDWLVLPGKAMILLMAPVVVYLYLPFFCRLDITTAYEYLERRFNTAVRLFGSASFIAFQLMRMAIVIFLPSLALSTITGIDVYVCILIMGLLSTLYTAMGGMEAVVWTDVLQTVVLLGGMVIAVLVVAAEVGGLEAVLKTATAAGKTRMWNPSLSFTELATWSILLGTFALQFGPYTTDQSVIQRYLTTKDETAAARGVWLNGLLAIPVGLLFMTLGASFYVFFQAHPALLPLGMQNDEVLPLFVSGQLPAGLSGLVIAGVFAASMSSLDSSIHSIATACTVDWYERLSPGASDESCLRLARVLTVVLGAIAVGTASLLVAFDIRSLWFFFQKCLGLVSSGLVGVFILGIFTRRATSAGALIGAAVATAVLVYVTWFSALHFYLYPVVGIATCVGVGYLASRFRPESRHRDLTGLTRAAPGGV